MQTVNIHEAKTHPPRLIEKAAKGEAFIIAKAGKSTVKVVPLEDTDAFFSPASIWETAIRHAQARPDFRADPSILRERLSFKTAKSRCPSTEARTCYRSTPAHSQTSLRPDSDRPVKDRMHSSGYGRQRCAAVSGAAVSGPHRILRPGPRDQFPRIAGRRRPCSLAQSMAIS